MTALDLPGLVALCEAAGTTRGPWRAEHHDEGSVIYGGMYDHLIARLSYNADAALIVGAVNALPALVAAIRTMEAVVAAQNEAADRRTAEIERLRALATRIEGERHAAVSTNIADELKFGEAIARMSAAMQITEASLATATADLARCRALLAEAVEIGRRGCMDEQVATDMARLDAIAREAGIE